MYEKMLKSKKEVRLKEYTYVENKAGLPEMSV